MTKELLEDYPHICAEIKRLSRVTVDSVRGSITEFPFTERNVTIKGIPQTDLELLALKRAQKVEVEEFMRVLPNSEMRRIVELRAFKRRKWNDVAAILSGETGMGYSGESIKQRYCRFIKKIL